MGVYVLTCRHAEFGCGDVRAYILSARTSTVVQSLGLSQFSITIKIVPDSNPHVKINNEISTSSTTFITIQNKSFVCFVQLIVCL